MATQLRDMLDRIQFRPALRRPALQRPGRIRIAVFWGKKIHARSNATNMR